jgi:hypothetical protein
MKIEAADNGAALQVTTPDGKSVEFVSAIDEETGLRRSVMVTRDAEGNVVSEQEMTDKEARRLAKQLAKTDERVNGDVSEKAEKAYKTIRRASSTELHHAKSIIPEQQNEDGSTFSLTRGRNGLEGAVTLNGENMHYNIIKDHGTVHYVITEENGHQRIMSPEERQQVEKQIEESGDKKSIKKLHQYAKKTAYDPNPAQYTSNDNELSYTRGNAKLSMSLDENGRAQYQVTEGGKTRPMTDEEIKSMNQHVKADITKNASANQSENAAAGELPKDAQTMNKVLASQATEKFATQALGLDEKSLKIGVSTDQNGAVQATVAVSNNGAVYKPVGGNTTYAVLDEHKQVKAYTISNNQSVPLNAQDTARFVGTLQKQGMIDNGSAFGKAVNNTVNAARVVQSSTIQRT